MNHILNKIGLNIVRKKSLLHYATDKFLICSQKNILYQSKDAGSTWKTWLRIPLSFSTKLKIQTRLSRRLFRQYVYHVLPGKEFITVFGFGEIFIFSALDKKLISRTPIVGSRPLVVTEFNDDIYYGEYTSNVERKEIHLYKSKQDKSGFEAFHVFDNIRHIHSVQHDSFTSNLFIATGDNDEECFIGYLKDGNFIPLIQGTQQARGIQLLFTERYIYYATDAPHEKNYIYRIFRETQTIERLQEIGGPVFYGKQINGLFFFSTACEPSEVNNQKEVELWASENGKEWKCVQKFQKDFYHMKLFQYGQLLFPGGEEDCDFLYFTPFATEHDQTIIKIPLVEIKRLLKE